MIETTVGVFTLVQFSQTDTPDEVGEVDWHRKCWWCTVSEKRAHVYLRHRVQYKDGSRASPKIMRPENPCRLLICEAHMNDASIPRALQLATVAARLPHFTEVE